ncbi:MAG: exodeoxyribonuclease VII large subunit [Thermomicrobiales bacterium]|nr:exodeoxyribonuclease VII large subunit [Thermomicrobiales bacterium]
MRAAPLTVGEVTEYLQHLFDADELLSDLWIEGEVVETFVSGAGHHYFSVADDNARLNCVLFRNAAIRQRYRPVAGQGCAIHGRISIFPRDGKYQLYADFIRPAGVGLAALEFELLKQQLTAEGLFEQSRKRPLLERVRVIGLVTSAEGAVRHDVATVLQRRNPFIHLLFAPATVQGDGAPASLRMALQQLLHDGRCQVIIIGRGGGSATDLAAFNDEQLVRAVFASPIPVVSAVGHESDWTLLDLVADLRAATPSAAAEIVSAPSGQAARQLLADLMRHSHGFRRSLFDQMLDVSRCREELIRRGPLATISNLTLRLDEQSDALQLLTMKSLEARRAALSTATSSIQTRARERVGVSKVAAASAGSLLAVLDPRATLDRGYVALADAETGGPVNLTTDTAPGRRLVAHTRDGSIASVVESTQLGATS